MKDEITSFKVEAGKNERCKMGLFSDGLGNMMRW